MRNTASQTDGMTVKLGISLSDETHAAVAAGPNGPGRPDDTVVSRVSCRDAGLADPDRLRTRLDARQQSISDWKSAHRRTEGGVA